ncbi:hypothetical protein AArcSl_2978 [Halalkaliarchaeum desulfuricum]|uniref:Uncharacterized protein n=1 Tax=Halalkaliarchaeum desulfuricum TaxID=2055893 RepID=A0A343TNB7_9EURY|nr:hypothetical protein AArcSl_2978 [Halalkaliarchaeum desulfuricum]
MRSLPYFSRCIGGTIPSARAQTGETEHGTVSGFHRGSMSQPIRSPNHAVCELAVSLI